jgi:hypothetical protein
MGYNLSGTGCAEKGEWESARLSLPNLVTDLFSLLSFSEGAT